MLADLFELEIQFLLKRGINIGQEKVFRGFCEIGRQFGGNLFQKLVLVVLELVQDNQNVLVQNVGRTLFPNAVQEIVIHCGDSEPIQITDLFKIPLLRLQNRGNVYLQTFGPYDLKHLVQIRRDFFQHRFGNEFYQIRGRNEMFDRVFRDLLRNLVDGKIRRALELHRLHPLDFRLGFLEEFQRFVCIKFVALQQK